MTLSVWKLKNTSLPGLKCKISRHFPITKGIGLGDSLSTQPLHIHPLHAATSLLSFALLCSALLLIANVHLFTISSSSSSPSPPSARKTQHKHPPHQANPRAIPQNLTLTLNPRKQPSLLSLLSPRLPLLHPQQ